jgi:hypothetical protein
MQKKLTTKTVIAAVAVALMATSAQAQGMGKGKRQQQNVPKAEDQAKKRPPSTHIKTHLKAYRYRTKSSTLGKVCARPTQSAASFISKRGAVGGIGQ